MLSHKYVFQTLYLMKNYFVEGINFKHTIEESIQGY